MSVSCLDLRAWRDGRMLAALAAMLLVALWSTAFIEHQGTTTAAGELSSSGPASPSSAWHSLPQGLRTSIDRSLGDHRSGKSSRDAATGLETKLGPGGTVHVAVAGEPAAGWTLAPRSFGREGRAPEMLRAGSRASHAGRTTFALGRVSAWYVKRGSELEQGFTLRERPAGGDGQVALTMTSSGSLTPHLNTAGSLQLRNSAGRPVLSYRHLRVTDARGRVLPSRLALSGDRVRIVYQDRGAVYPVRIDPTIIPDPTPVATFSGSSGSGALLGSSVAVSANGQTVVVGASAGAGEVQVFSQSNGAWPTTPTATLTAPGGGKLGSSVAVSADGRTITAGAPVASGGVGAADVFVEPSSGWSNSTTPTAVLTDSSDTGISAFGSAVAVSADGQTVAAGVPAPLDGDGAVDLFEKPAGGWSTTSAPTATLAGPSGSLEGLGTSVAISANGQTVVAGAPTASLVGPLAPDGAVEVFTEPAGGWSSTSTATATFTGPSDSQEGLGISVGVSADGQTIVAGAWLAGDGAVDVFAEPSGGWTSASVPTATLTATGDSADGFGFSAAISADGRTVAAGAIGLPSMDNATDGRIAVFSEPSAGWGSTATPIVTYTGTGGSHEALGSAVAVSANGQTIVGGAEDAHGGDGQAFVYGTRALTWSINAVLTATGSSGDRLGGAVAVSANGQTVAVGAASAASGVGQVEVFTEVGGSWSTTPAATLTAPAGAGTGFGASVAISANGQTVIAGAPNANTGAGAAAVFVEPSGGWSGATNAAAVLADSSESSGSLGSSVAMAADGRTVVGGMSNGAGIDVFAEPSGGWSNASAPTAKLTDPSESGAGFGISVAISADGRTIVGGAPSAGADDTDGAVAVYTTPSGAWSDASTPTVTLAAPSGSQGALGSAVAVSATGQMIVAGAPHTSSNAGAVDIFMEAAGGWSTSTGGTTAVLSSTSGGRTVQLGSSVSVAADGRTVVAGAPAAGTDGNDGVVSVFAEPSGGWVSTSGAGTNYAPQSASHAALGSSVTLSADGQTVVAGGPGAGGGAGTALVQTVAEARASTTTVTANASVPFSSAAQSVMLSASVASASGWPVETGSMSFTVSGPQGVVGGQASHMVSGGMASVSYGLPAGAKAGTYTLTVTYTGNSTDFTGSNVGFLSSTDSTHTVTVVGVPQTVSFTPPSTATLGGSSPLSATGGASGEPVVFTSATPLVCTVSGTTVAYIAAGTCTIDASQAGTNMYAPAQTSGTVTVPQASSAITLSPPASFTSGQTPSTVTATVTQSGTATASGAVQFTVDGQPLSGPIAVAANGTAVSPALTNPDGSALGAGSHQVGATFTPTDTADYLSSTAASQTLIVGAPAVTNTTTTPTTTTPPATSTPSTTTTPVTTPKPTVTNPVIDAKISTTGKRSSSGWYRAPVTLTFTCTAGSAALTGACPAKVVLSKDGAKQTLTRSITATDGGSASVTVEGIDIDRTAPSVSIAGLTKKSTYTALPKKIRCAASDRVSGVASCKLKSKKSKGRNGAQTITYMASATDRAGNTRTIRRTITLR